MSDVGMRSITTGTLYLEQAEKMLLKSRTRTRIRIPDSDADLDQCKRRFMSRCKKRKRMFSGCNKNVVI